MMIYFVEPPGYVNNSVEARRCPSLLRKMLIYLSNRPFDKDGDDDGNDCDDQGDDGDDSDGQDENGYLVSPPATKSIVTSPTLNAPQACNHLNTYIWDLFSKDKNVGSIFSAHMCTQKVQFFHIECSTGV